jgi:hypothetical protein
MRIRPIEPPRPFRVGRDRSIELRHAADVELDPDEQVTFVTASGTEFDVVRKAWGYYATPSLNQRLPDHGLRPVLVRGEATGRLYLLLVERGREPEFQEYADWDRLRVLAWLDDPAVTDEVARRLAGGDGDLA